MRVRPTHRCGMYRPYLHFESDCARSSVHGLLPFILFSMSVSSRPYLVSSTSCVDDTRFSEGDHPTGCNEFVTGRSQILFGSMGRLSENGVVNLKNKSHAPLKWSTWLSQSDPAFLLHEDGCLSTRSRVR